MEMEGSDTDEGAVNISPEEGEIDHDYGNYTQDHPLPYYGEQLTNGTAAAPRQ